MPIPVTIMENLVGKTKKWLPIMTKTVHMTARRRSVGSEPGYCKEICTDNRLDSFVPPG